MLYAKTAEHAKRHSGGWRVSCSYPWKVPSPVFVKSRRSMMSRPNFFNFAVGFSWLLSSNCSTRLMEGLATAICFAWGDSWGMFFAVSIPFDTKALMLLCLLTCFPSQPFVTKCSSTRGTKWFIFRKLALSDLTVLDHMIAICRAA